jgi:hypothetical protein
VAAATKFVRFEKNFYNQREDDTVKKFIALMAVACALSFASVGFFANFSTSYAQEEEPKPKPKPAPKPEPKPEAD